MELQVVALQVVHACHEIGTKGWPVKSGFSILVFLFCSRDGSVFSSH